MLQSRCDIVAKIEELIEEMKEDRNLIYTLSCDERRIDNKLNQLSISILRIEKMENKDE